MEDDQTDVVERLRSLLAHANEKRESSFFKFIRRITSRLRRRTRKAAVKPVEGKKKKAA
jgi:hypothetical protein